MFYFPKRPIDKRGFYRRRSWNSDIHRYDDVVFHMDAAHSCYADVGQSVPCGVGQSIEYVRDLSQYGNHASNAGATRYPLVSDSGFLAAQTNGLTSTQLITTASLQLGMQIVVFRAQANTWGVAGAALGRSVDTRAYLFGGSSTGFANNPSTVQRQNGITMTPGSLLSTIDVPMVLVLGHTSPATISQWMIGRAWVGANSLFIYEILAFSSILPVEDIEQIEAYLMDKYGIAGV